jgi:hypothetical protein
MWFRYKIWNFNTSIDSYWFHWEAWKGQAGWNGKERFENCNLKWILSGNGVVRLWRHYFWKINKCFWENFVCTITASPGILAIGTICSTFFIFYSRGNVESGSFSYMRNSVCKYIRNSAKFRGIPVNFTAKNTAEFRMFFKKFRQKSKTHFRGHPNSSPGMISNIFPKFLSFIIAKCSIRTLKLWNSMWFGYF